MKTITRYSTIFLLLFAAVFTSCEDEQDTDIPVITLSGSNPLTYETIGSDYNEPGVTASEGSIHIDYSALNMDRRGESFVYYYATDDNNNVGRASRRVIVKNPSETLTGTYNVEIKDVGSGNLLDIYVDDITPDDYANGKFRMSNFDGSVCGVDQPVFGNYDKNNNTVDVLPNQVFNNQGVSNNTGSPFGVNINGSEISFEMVINVGGTEKRYTYRRRNEEAAVATVKVAHVASDVSSLTLLGDNVVKTTDPMTFIGPPMDVIIDGGTRSIKFNTAACSTLISTITPFNANSSYTMFLTGNQVNNNLEIINLENDLSLPPGGQARVRFLHAADGVNNVDIIDNVTNAVYFSNVGFKSNVTSNINVGTYELKMVDPGTQNQVPNSSNVTVTFSEGKVYTIYSFRDNNNGNVGINVISNN